MLSVLFAISFVAASCVVDSGHSTRARYDDQTEVDDGKYVAATGKQPMSSYNSTTEHSSSEQLITRKSSGRKGSRSQKDITPVSMPRRKESHRVEGVDHNCTDRDQQLLLYQQGLTEFPLLPNAESTSTLFFGPHSLEVTHSPKEVTDLYLESRRSVGWLVAPKKPFKWLFNQPFCRVLQTTEVFQRYRLYESPENQLLKKIYPNLENPSWFKVRVRNEVFSEQIALCIFKEHGIFPVFASRGVGKYGIFLYDFDENFTLMGEQPGLRVIKHIQLDDGQLAEIKSGMQNYNIQRQKSIRAFRERIKQNV